VSVVRQERGFRCWVEEAERKRERERWMKRMVTVGVAAPIWRL